MGFYLRSEYSNANQIEKYIYYMIILYFIGLHMIEILNSRFLQIKYNIQNKCQNNKLVWPNDIYM